MLVLGIDPGSLVTGYGVVERMNAGKYARVADGEIKTSANGSLASRLFNISTEINEIIATYKPEAVSVEGIFFGKNVRSAVILAHVRGVALLSAESAGLEIFEYSPATIKEAVVGNGRATKEQVQHMVKLLLGGTTPAGPDSADALAAAICHINHTGPLARVSGC